MSFHKLDAVGFLAQFEPECYPQLLTSLRAWPTATHMVRFSNHELSSDLGPLNAFALCCGPDNTLKSLDDLASRNGMSPLGPPTDRHRNWLYYADNYAERQELLEELERRCS